MATKKATSKKTSTAKGKTSKAKKQQIDEKNVVDTIKATVESTRAIKWKMPRKDMTLAEKRAFRQKYRNELRKLEAELHKNPSKKLEKEYKELRKEVLMVP